MNELDYLLDTYFNKEDWHTERLSRESAEIFYRRQLEQKNIVFLKSSNNEEIQGYLEIWWLDQRQLSLVTEGKEFHAFNEDLVSGDFVFAASAYLEPAYRNKGNLKKMIQMMKDIQDHEHVGVVYEDGQNEGKFSFYKKGEI